MFSGTTTAGWASSPSNKLTGIWGAAAQPNSTQWKCDACLVSNKADSNVCVACSTAKPGGSTSGADKKPAAAATQWKCSTCLVTNPANVSLCASCGACKPGTQSSLGDITQGKQLPLYGVKFGGPLPSNTTSDKTEASGSSVTTKPLSSIFGSTAPLAPQSVSASGGMKISGGFNFGSFSKKTEEPKNDSSAEKSDNQAGKAEDIKVVTEKAEDSKPTAADTSSTEQSKAVTFGITGTSSNKGDVKTPLFQFGSVSKPPAEATDSSDAPPAKLPFQFGKSSTSESTQPFQVAQTGAKPAAESSSVFGQTSSSISAATQPSTGLFQFGAKPATTQPVVASFSFGSATTSQPGSTAETATSKALADSSKSAAAFTFGSQSSSNPLQATSSAEPTKALFQFGAKPSQTSTDTNKPLFQAASQQPAAGKDQLGASFSFGTKPATDKASEPATNLFQFGGASAQPSTTAPPVFQFGAKKDPSQQPAAASNTGLFGSVGSASVFGSGGSTGPGLFGATATTTASQPVPSNQGIFSSSGSSVFGSAAKPPSSTGFAFGSASTAGASFNFGAGSAATGQPSSTFQFGAGSSSSGGSSSLFQFGSAAAPASAIPPAFTSESQQSDSSNSSPAFTLGTAGNRVIKKATRRLKK